MKLVWGLFILIALTACHPGADDSVYLNDSDSIIGGSYVQADNPIAKSTVVLFSVNPSTGMPLTACTAIILTKDILLTAAHCVLDSKTHSKPLSPQIFAVNSGNIIEKDFNGSRLARVKTIKLHAKSKIDGYDTRYDLALLQLDRDVPSDMVPAEFYNGKLSEGMRVVVAGFGNDSVRNGMSLTMRLKVYNDFKILNQTSTQITLEGPPGLGSFQGDSGGPGFIRVNGKLKLWGVSSLYFWQQKNKSITGQARYEDLSYSRTWIKNTIVELNTK